MKLLTILTFSFILCSTGLAQTYNQDKISKSDSLLLSKFWQSFKTSITDKNKAELSKLLSFPFYCPQCRDYTPANDGITVLVNEVIFDTSVYELFFTIPDMNKQNKELWSKDFVFRTSDDDYKKKKEFQFSYVISYPSKTWEGSQGFIYLKKIKGKYLISGMNTVP